MRKLQKIALPYQVKTAALQYTITAVPFLGKFTAQIDVRLPQALRGRYIIRYAYDTASEIPAENLIKYFAKPDLNTYLAFNC